MVDGPYLPMNAFSLYAGVETHYYAGSLVKVDAG